METTDRLFESIHSVIRTNPVKIQLNIPANLTVFRLPTSNTAKYFMGTSLYGSVDKYTDLLCLQNVSTYHMTKMLFSHHFIAIDTV